MAEGSLLNADRPLTALVDLALLFLTSIVLGGVLTALFGDPTASQARLLGGLAVQQVLVVGAGALFLAHRRGLGSSPAEDGRSPGSTALSTLLGRRASLAAIGGAVAIGVAVAFVQTPILRAWTTVVTASEPQWYAVALNMDGLARSIAVVAVVACLAPLCEELLFRGYLLERLKSAPSGNLAQAALFTVFHGDPYGVPVYLAVGLILGALRTRTASLWPCIALHASVNALGIWEHASGSTLWDALLG